MWHITPITRGLGRGFYLKNGIILGVILVFHGFFTLLYIVYISRLEGKSAPPAAIPN